MAERIEQSPDVGNDSDRGGGVKFWFGLRLVRTEGPVLHVDDKKRGAALNDWSVAGERLGWHDPVFQYLCMRNKPQQRLC